MTPVKLVESLSVEKPSLRVYTFHTRSLSRAESGCGSVGNTLTSFEKEDCIPTGPIISSSDVNYGNVPSRFA